MLGRRSLYAELCNRENFIGADYGIDEDLTDELTDNYPEFNRKFIPLYLENAAAQTKIAAGLACGALWMVTKGIAIGDIVLCPTGSGKFMVGEVNSAYYFVEGDVLPHRRKVKWFPMLIRRANVSLELRTSTNSGGPVVNVAQHATEIERYIAGETTGSNNFDFVEVIKRFLAQTQTGDLGKKGYPGSYQNLELKVGFGVGLATKIPWIGLIKPPNKITSGIYPIYLYYKIHEVLVLAYGISEAERPEAVWPDTDKIQTIKNWFKENKNAETIKYGSSYVKAVYHINDELNPEIIQSDLNEIIDEYSDIDFEVTAELPVVGEPLADDGTKKYWLLAPGERAFLWDEFNEKGIAAIGWDEMEDLTKYSSRDEIREALLLKHPDSETSQGNNSLCLWEFSHVMKVGDVIIAKTGISEYLGYGIVTGEYHKVESRGLYKHIRSVDWKKKGKWDTPGQIVTKTLTDITKYPTYVDRLRRLVGIEQEATVDTEKIEYYWLNANPKYWRIEDFQVGDEQAYTTHNESGNKRSRFEYFQKIKPGDLVIGYETTPTKKVVAIFEITRGAYIDDDDGLEKISFIIQKFLPNPVSYEALKGMPDMEKSEVMRNNQGSLFKLTKAEFNAIINRDILTEKALLNYSITEAEKEIFLSKDTLENIIQSLEYKKNIILQGPPGVGKTFMAKRLAYLAMEAKDNSKIEMIQFHQSYSYEDFIQGYRPKEDGGFKLENGVFYRFCKRAQTDPDNKYFFIIDEINRGNLSKIFGELMLLIEADKRGLENAVSLTYSLSNENRFYIPANVYMIGTMNTADRSLAVVDYALRRRFAFITVAPSFNTKFKNELINLGVDESIIDQIAQRISLLNDRISKDGNLGDGFRVGHSYFCNVPKGLGDKEWYHRIVKNELTPLLEEYWFDNTNTSKMEITNLYI